MKPSKIMFSTLRAEMSRENITILDLAKSIGCTRDTMSNWLSGKTPISLETAFTIQRSFFPNITVKELFLELLSKVV